MVFKAKYQTSSYVFTGNPIILESEGYSVDPVRGGRFAVNLGGKEIYTGRFFPPLNIDIAEIVASATENYSEPSFKTQDPIELIEAIGNTAGADKRHLSVKVEYNEWDDETYEMTALPGGIPGQQFSVYAREGKDIFDSRLCGPGSNFFFTSRTVGWRIEIKETELYPLYFLSTGQNYVVRSSSGNKIDQDVPGGIAALNLNQVRQVFIDKHGELPAVFDIETEDGGFCCRIVITHCDPAKERYRLKFRNSFGVFEIMEITGKLTDGTEFEEGEERIYRRLDPVTRRFSNLRERLEGKTVLGITTPLDKGYLNLMADLISSEEIYLLDAFKVPVRVNVTCEDLSMRRRQEEPESVTLKMELTDPDHYFGEEISGTDDSRKPRVHTRQFINKFN